MNYFENVFLVQHPPKDYEFRVMLTGKQFVHIVHCVTRYLGYKARANAVRSERKTKKPYTLKEVGFDLTPYITYSNYEEGRYVMLLPLDKYYNIIKMCDSMKQRVTIAKENRYKYKSSANKGVKTFSDNYNKTSMLM